MLSGIIFTIGSFFFMILLQFSYFSQGSLNEIQNKLFRYLMTVQILLTVSEIIAVISAVYGSNALLTLILYRIHWATGILIFYFFYLVNTVIYFLYKVCLSRIVVKATRPVLRRGEMSNHLFLFNSVSCG